jgi:dolichyldiphosphatase
VYRAIFVLGLIIVTALVCYGRLYLMYHTLSQVIVGSIVGLVTGLVWFVFVHAVLTPYVFPKIVSWRISELLLIRDTSLIPNILFFEYTATRQESRARLRKNMKMQ